VGLAVALVLGVAIPLPAQGSASRCRHCRPEVIASDAGDTKPMPRTISVVWHIQVGQESGDTVHALSEPDLDHHGLQRRAQSARYRKTNVKAWGAIEALDVSTGRLNSAVDRAWQRGEACPSLPCRPSAASICRGAAAASWPTTLPSWNSLMIEPGCEQACRVIAPLSV